MVGIPVSGKERAISRILSITDNGTAATTGHHHHHGARLNNKMYNHMSLMLKSLLCVTRALPAYR